MYYSFDCLQQGTGTLLHISVYGVFSALKRTISTVCRERLCCSNKKCRLRQYFRLFCDWSGCIIISFPDGYSTGGCVCPLSLRSSEPTRWFSQMTPDEYPRRHHLADGPLSSLCAPSPSLSSFGATSVVMCCSSRPASSSALSVLPEDRIGRNIVQAQKYIGALRAPHFFLFGCVKRRLSVLMHV